MEPKVKYAAANEEGTVFVGSDPEEVRERAGTERVAPLAPSTSENVDPYLESIRRAGYDTVKLD